MGPVTDQERLGWQLRAATALADLLGEATTHKDLPPIAWEIGSLGALAGMCTQHDQAARRHAFEAWVRFLGLEPSTEHEISGAVYLRASARDWRGRRIDVVVRATLERVEPEDAAGQPPVLPSPDMPGPDEGGTAC